MDKKEAIDPVNKYIEIIKEYFPISYVILFGSYAKETQHANSDIDVAVIVDELPDNILQSEFLLNKLRRDIDLRIEPILIEKGNDPGGFLENFLILE
jgi:predicted nucleotidyltransferase